MSEVRVNKNEWEAFLSDFAELSKKYEQVLTELDLTKTKMKNHEEKMNQQISKNKQSLRQVRESIDHLCKTTEALLNEPE